MASWLRSTLNLESELSLERDRRAAARLTRDELQILADKLICDAYNTHNLLAQAIARVTSLEVELMLAKAQPSKPEPGPQHWQWAKQLLGRG